MLKLKPTYATVFFKITNCIPKTSCRYAICLIIRTISCARGKKGYFKHIWVSHRRKVLRKQRFSCLQYTGRREKAGKRAQISRSQYFQLTLFKKIFEFVFKTVKFGDFSMGMKINQNYYCLRVMRACA